MAASHTPGPWTLEDPLGPELLSIVVGDEPHQWQFIAQVSAAGNREEGDVPKAQAKANAHLIAAAPEMLAALKAIAALMNDGGRLPENGPTHRTALAAIAKAEGR
jgi:hypothetical protein